MRIVKSKTWSETIGTNIENKDTDWVYAFIIGDLIGRTRKVYIFAKMVR